MSKSNIRRATKAFLRAVTNGLLGIFVFFIGITLTVTVLVWLDSRGYVSSGTAASIQNPEYMFLISASLIPAMVTELLKENSEIASVAIESPFLRLWGIITADSKDSHSIPESERYHLKRRWFADSASSLYPLLLPGLLIVPVILEVYTGRVDLTQLAIGYVGLGVSISIVRDGFGFISVRTTEEARMKSEVNDVVFSHIEFSYLGLGAFFQLIGTFGLPRPVLLGRMVLIGGMVISIVLAYAVVVLRSK